MNARCQAAETPGPPTLTVQSSPVSLMLKDLLQAAVIRPQDWQRLDPGARTQLERQPDLQRLLAQLVEQRLLTAYQAARAGAGGIDELLLGNYRVLEHLGSGGMGVVYKAEHLLLCRPVAIKVLRLAQDEGPQFLQRFLSEIWALAQLQHPNIVGILDAGQTAPGDPTGPLLRYFVMEYVAGQDLHQQVSKEGPLAWEKACDLVYQVASALAEAHKHNLIHRDIKPSNIRVTPDGVAKLLDFGVARHFPSQLTERGMVLGTIDYLAPEQARDAHTVDGRADIYSLGSTLFWCLTGRPPFPFQGNLVKALQQRQSQPPPSLRTGRPDIPDALEGVVARMMALDANDRYPTAQAVMRALLPFLEGGSHRGQALRPEPAAEELSRVLDASRAQPRTHRILIVDDEPGVRALCRAVLEAEDYVCDEAGDGSAALAAVQAQEYDLVLLDVDMPGMRGTEVLRRLRERPPTAHLKVIMLSAHISGDDMAQLLGAGATDYLVTKPFSPVQLVGRARASLQLKEAQERVDLLNRNLLAVNQDLERNLHARDSDLIHARNALVLALAELVAYRDSETGAHLMRMQRFCRCLAEEAAAAPGLAEQIDLNFIQMLECCAPLHDIGKVGIPDYILLKPGKLEPEERILMQTHTTIGAQTLRKVARQHGFARTFLHLAADIARHHHERYDGKGYPDRLAGDAIPLAARLVAIADTYDALRSRRCYKPALSHAAAVQMMTEESPGRFDPALLQAFRRCSEHFEQIYRELTAEAD